MDPEIVMNSGFLDDIFFIIPSEVWNVEEPIRALPRTTIPPPPPVSFRRSLGRSLNEIQGSRSYFSQHSSSRSQSSPL
jgi:hypothetical protein